MTSGVLEVEGEDDDSIVDMRRNFLDDACAGGAGDADNEGILTRSELLLLLELLLFILAVVVVRF